MMIIMNEVLNNGIITEETSKALTDTKITVDLKSIFIDFVGVSKDYIIEQMTKIGKVTFEVIVATMVVWAVFCAFTSIFGTKKFSKHIPLTMGIYFLLKAVKECLL